MDRTRGRPVEARIAALASDTTYRFAGFVLETARGALRSPGDEEVILRPKTAEVLRHFAENAGRLVGRDELMRAVWPDVFVTDDSISQCVAEIRRTLGPKGSGLLRTLPKRGYLLAAEVVHGAASAPSDMAAPGPGGNLPSAGSPDDRPTLAVLPFENMSGDPGQDYFADGVVEEITTALSRIGGILVVARGSAFAYKGRAVDVRQVGRELGVRYALEGSVRKAGNQARIAGRLVETGTGHQVWADRFDGQLADVFDLQDRIAEAVAGAIEPSLRSAEIARAFAKPTADLGAYDLYLRALAEQYRNLQGASDAALDLLRRAVELDPSYAVAKGLAAYCRALRVVQGWARAGEAEEAVALAREAVRDGRDDPEALRTGCQPLAFFGADYDAAIMAAERAVGLNPNSAAVRAAAGFVHMAACEPGPAVVHFERAIRLSPRAPEIPRMLAGLGLAQLMAGNRERALELAAAAVCEAPAWAAGHRLLIVALQRLGRTADARAAASRLLKLMPEVHAAAAHLKDQRFYEAYVQALHDAGVPD